MWCSLGQGNTAALGKKCRQAKHKVFVALNIPFALTVAGFAQQASPPIVTDVNTQTTLNISGNLTDISTFTISGNDAYNSFSNFNVLQNNVVNLFLPSGTENHLNLVNSSQSMNVDGVLNSIKNGSIGGNVFFADPSGGVVGDTGVVNVGSFTGETPTQDFMNQFFSSPDNPTAAGTTAILGRTAPLSPDGQVSVNGTVNATGDRGSCGRAATTPDTIPVVKVTVADTGPGIPAEYHTEIFREFFRIPNQKDNPEGTGLGLSIALQIVHAHEGRMWAENEGKEGTRICFVVPVRRQTELLE